jgi:hypothetical protein
VIPNIGPRGQAQRRRFGYIALAFSAVLAVILVASGLPSVWRLVVFLPLWLSALGFFQAKDKT